MLDKLSRSIKSSGNTSHLVSRLRAVEETNVILCHEEYMRYHISFCKDLKFSYELE